MVEKKTANKCERRGKMKEMSAESKTWESNISIWKTGKRKFKNIKENFFMKLYTIRNTTDRRFEAYNEKKKTNIKLYAPGRQDTGPDASNRQESFMVIPSNRLIWRTANTPSWSNMITNTSIRASHLLECKNDKRTWQYLVTFEWSLIRTINGCASWCQWASPRYSNKTPSSSPASNIQRS